MKRHSQAAIKQAENKMQQSITDYIIMLIQNNSDDRYEHIIGLIDEAITQGVIDTKKPHKAAKLLNKPVAEVKENCLM